MCQQWICWEVAESPRSALFKQLQQVAPVAGLEQGVGALGQLVVVDVAHPPGHSGVLRPC
jgi:hypothetical protein